MTNKVDHFGQPVDRFHTDYESFKDWLDAEAPDAGKTRNQPRYAPKRGNAITLAALVRR